MRIAFIFEGVVAYPPDFNNIKCHYVTKEMLSRGYKVTWLMLDNLNSKTLKEGINMEVLNVPKIKFLHSILTIFLTIKYCLQNHIDLVYIDEWFYLRRKLLMRLFFHIMLRIVRTKCVLDQRDPVVDYEVATGIYAEGSLRFKIRKLVEILIYKQVDLIIMPSRRYAQYIASQKYSKTRVLGIFRGIDLGLFNPQANGTMVRQELGLDDRLIIGWFGVMHKFRLIDEVLLRLIEHIREIHADCYLLIGGEGPERQKVVKLLDQNRSLPAKYIGAIKYQSLPSYLAACDILLCPTTLKHRFTLLTSWLKIPEAIAVGRPVIATKNLGAYEEFSALRGIIWTGSTYDGLFSSLKVALPQLQLLKHALYNQPNSLRRISISATVPLIVNEIDRIINRNN